MSRSLTASLTLCVALWAASPSPAAYLNGVTATTDMGVGYGTLLANAVNGVGLASPSLTAMHAYSDPSNAWISASGATTGTITFDLHGLFTLSGLSVWNLGVGPGDFGASGIAGVRLSASTDGVTFNLVAGGPSSFAKITTDLDSLPPQVIAFGSVAARYVRLAVLGNHGDPNATGLAEVAFNGVSTASVPEPSSLALCGLALAIGLAARRGRHPACGP